MAKKTASKAKTNSKFSPSEQAAKLYQAYVKELGGEYTKLVGSLQKFLTKARRKVEELDKANEAAVLSRLDESLKRQ